jgi:hypothetical protein
MFSSWPQFGQRGRCCLSVSASAIFCRHLGTGQSCILYLPAVNLLSVAIASVLVLFYISEMLDAMPLNIQISVAMPSLSRIKVRLSP